MKAILNADAVNAYIDFHKDLKIPFKMSISNYTTRITSNAVDIHFMKTEQSNRVFAAYNRTKSEVTKHKIKKINSFDLQYYSHAFKDENFYSDIIFNVDLKSAYATVLFNDGLISKKTYSYLCSLPKMQRLAAVGMLAGKKTIFQIDEAGEVQDEQTIISPTADYFFYCVKRVSEIINEASQHLGQSFLFSWVDGIYFLENPDSAIKAGEIIKEFFAEKGFKSSFDTLTEFTVKLNNTHFHCSYKKEDVFKTMNVPRYDNIAVKKITNYLLKKDY